MKTFAKPLKSIPKGVCNLSCRESGLILVELLISISIALLLLSLLMQIWLTYLNSLKLETTLTRIEANAKHLTSILTKEIHQAGHIGCARWTDDFPLFSADKYQKITGNAANEFTVSYAQFPGFYLVSFMRDHYRIYINDTTHIHTGDLLLISDCKEAEIFHAQNIRRVNGMLEITSGASLHKRYEKFAELSRFNINKFYIAKSPFENSFSLFREGNREKSELVMGVNKMQIKYSVRGVDLPANQVQNWSAVSGVAIDFELSEGSLKKTWHMYAALR